MDQNNFALVKLYVQDDKVHNLFSLLSFCGVCELSSVN